MRASWPPEQAGRAGGSARAYPEGPGRVAQLLSRCRLSQAAPANGGFGRDAEHPGRNGCLSWPGHTAAGRSQPRPVTVTFPRPTQAAGEGAAPRDARVMAL